MSPESLRLIVIPTTTLSTAIPITAITTTRMASLPSIINTLKFKQYQRVNNSFGIGLPCSINADCGYGSASNDSMPRPPRKRDQVDGGCHVKVYVAPVARTAKEADICHVFQGHGTIVEVNLLKDKRTGTRRGSCLVKYSTLDEAGRTIRALSNQYTFPGPVKE